MSYKYLKVFKKLSSKVVVKSNSKDYVEDGRALHVP